MAGKILSWRYALLPLCLSSLLFQYWRNRTNLGNLQCRALQIFLPGRLSRPGTSVYNTSVGSYWSQQEQEVLPACILSPRTTQDVAKAVSILSRASVAATAFGGKCSFAIRGGGHTPFAGSANINRGVTIDLSGLNTISVNHDQTVVSVGPGNKWKDVYSKLDPLGIAVSGGRVADIGVAGLTTGGGMSYFAPRYGFACDNVENFEVVLANGRTVKANAKENSDLWQALKGGSNNLGIVTRIDLRAFKQGDIWAGFIYNPIETRPTQIEAFVQLNAASNYDPYASLIMSFGYSAAAGATAVANNLVYTKPQAYPATYKPLTDIQPQFLNSMKIQSLSTYVSASSDFQPNGQRYLFVTRTVRNDQDLLNAAFENFNETLQAILTVKGLNFALVFQALPASITEKASATGGNVLGLEDERESLVLILLTTQWTSAADDTSVNTAAKSFLSTLDQEAQRRNATNPWIYLNYAAPFQDPIASYGSSNKAKLQAVSKKYDPKGLFQKSVPGGFKLFA